MDFRADPEIEQFIEGVRRFRERELAPMEAQFLRDGRLDTETRQTLTQRARDLGFWALDAPEEYGGEGMGVLATCMIAEELYRSPLMFEFGGSPEFALLAGNDEQKNMYIGQRIVTEGKRGSIGFTEPDAGSDLAALRTTATRDGDNWIINGTKTFISHANVADFVIVWATVDPTLGGRGVTCFIVDTGTPGYELSRPIPTMGDDWEPYELTFRDCVVPDTQRLGEIGAGWKIAADQLTHGRAEIAAYNLGIAQASLDLAIDWSKNRVTWGKPLSHRQAIQWMIADSEVELQAARLMVYKAAWMADAGEEIHTEAMAAKLFASEMAQRVTDRCLQIFGGLGYTREVAVQSFYRQARVWRIGHGTTEINRWMIARHLLNLSSRDA